MLASTYVPITKAIVAGHRYHLHYYEKSGIQLSSFHVVRASLWGTH
jgi:hypothetical protein